MELLREVHATVAAAAETVGPAVVGLSGRRRGASGVVISQDRVLTVAHAVHGDEAEVVFADRRRADARVEALDGDSGVALLAVDTGEVAPVAWEPREPPGLGAPVLALADPGGRGLRVTLGFVTAAQASLRGPRGRRVPGAVEHSAPLPRGSSGGPLVDPEGRLVGLNAVRAEGGLIVALPTDQGLKSRLARLARGEPVTSRRLGVAIAPAPMARRMRAAVGLPDREGLLLRAVEEGSAAHRAGLERGDLLVSADGRALHSVDVLHAALEAADALTLRVVRGTDERDVEIGFDTPRVVS